MPKIIYIGRKKKVFFLLCVVVFAVIATLYAFNKNYPLDKPVFAAEKDAKTTSSIWIGLVENVLGISRSLSAQNEPFLDKVLSQMAQTDITEPKRMLALQLMAGPGKEEWYVTEPDNEEIVIPVPKEDKKLENLPPVEKTDIGKPLIGIYNTHNAETYLLTDGVEKMEGKNGGVSKAAQALKNALEGKGIGAVVDTTIHDYPNWPKSYSNSLKTAKKLLTEYPSIQILIDIHRDAMPSRENSIVKINGLNTARISFIVGSDTRLPHPNWRKNWAYANFLAEKMEARYPGLLKTVRVQSGRYNQHINAHGILIEVGSTKNSTAEAERAMDYFAEVLAESITVKR